jgi:hypothetical protein
MVIYQPDKNPYGRVRKTFTTPIDGGVLFGYFSATVGRFLLGNNRARSQRCGS